MSVRDYDSGNVLGNRIRIIPKNIHTHTNKAQWLIIQFNFWRYISLVNGIAGWLVRKGFNLNLLSEFLSLKTCAVSYSFSFLYSTK